MRSDLTIGNSEPRAVELLALQLAIHTEVLDESAAWIARSPTEEVGGKYIGRIHGDFDAAADDWVEQLAAVRLEVVHHLDCGPAAVRTPTYHLPDGAYQEATFRAVEAEFPTVRHLGSWHSHHPNGMRTLSLGDIRGYRRDVNSPHHGHDLFLASLATDREGLRNARHFVFVRDRQECFEIDPKGVSELDGPNEYASIVHERRRRAQSAVEREHPAPAGFAPLSVTGLLRAVQEWWNVLMAQLRWALGRMTGDADPARQSELRQVQKGEMPPEPPTWTVTEKGQEALARDLAWIEADFPELKPRSRAGVLVWTGVWSYHDVSLTITMAYPDDYPAHPPTVQLTGSHVNAEITVRAILTAGADGSYRKSLFLLTRRCAGALADMGKARG